MLGFIVGVVLTAILYTFFPAIAVKPSNWLKSKWAAYQAKKGAPKV